MSDSSKDDSERAVDPATFGSVMGQAVWLMTMSADHKHLPISTIEELVSPAILFKQFRLFSKGKQPVAFLIWASVSDEVKARLEGGGDLEDIKDWRSGENIVVIDCISPLAPKQVFIEKFMASVRDAQSQTVQ